MIHICNHVLKISYNKSHNYKAVRVRPSFTANSALFPFFSYGFFLFLYLHSISFISILIFTAFFEVKYGIVAACYSHLFTFTFQDECSNRVLKEAGRTCLKNIVLSDLKYLPLNVVYYTKYLRLNRINQKCGV